MSKKENYPLIDKLHGKYGAYEIRKDSGWVSTSYRIYKNGDFWKSASSPINAVDKIKKYDSQAS